MSAAELSVDNRNAVRTSRAISSVQLKGQPELPSGTSASRPVASHATADPSTSHGAGAPVSVDGVLKLLARAIRQFHTYPATSPICVEAITACHDALTLLSHRDRLSFRVTPHDLIVDETTIGAGTVIEHELTRRLFRARVASLDIDRAATPRRRTESESGCNGSGAPMQECSRG